MSDNAKNKKTSAILAALLAALAAPAAELPNAATLTPAQFAAHFATAKFELRAAVQAPAPVRVTVTTTSLITIAATAPSAPRVTANF